MASATAPGVDVPLSGSHITDGTTRTAPRCKCHATDATRSASRGTSKSPSGVADARPARVVTALPHAAFVRAGDIAVGEERGRRIDVHLQRLDAGGQHDRDPGVARAPAKQRDLPRLRGSFDRGRVDREYRDRARKI